MFIDERCGTILFCCSLFDIKMTVSGVEFVNELLATFNNICEATVFPVLGLDSAHIVVISMIFKNIKYDTCDNKLNAQLCNYK